MSQVNKWIGRVATLWTSGVMASTRVRIIDTEQAAPNMDSRNPSGFWYWARYA